MFILRKIEYKVALIFSGIALFLSPLVGALSGISVGIVVFRTILLALFFAGIGFAIVTILKRFVPEVYNVINHSSDPFDTDVEAVDTGIEPEQGGESYREDGESAEHTEDEPESGMGAFDPGLAPSTSESLGIKDRAMGRHILKEKGVKYEPKIMAEAIRTMMSKDE
ncbi:MAG: hypothetical protein PF637_14740 [Spirochaetes bacterium]|jgi:hypothetical protein|nr:hypothetical protein [Spirochaetota bacterium]